MQQGPFVQSGNSALVVLLYLCNGGNSAEHVQCECYHSSLFLIGQKGPIAKLSR
ncbi:Hypothetical protein FKW44_005341, partial [Caligus rogercresseyi]